MNEEAAEEMFRKYITTEDLFRFKWRILKYMCDVSNIYNTFPEHYCFTELTLKLTSILNSAKNTSMAKEELSISSLWIM
jgi:hypothetical protein